MRLVPDAKIAIPELPRDFVGRPDLRSQLDTSAAVTLVCAPAGYGKTVLVADAVSSPGPGRASGSTDTAWVGLDADDNDPRRLWSAVVAAIRSCPSVPASNRIRAPWAWPASGAPDVLAELVGALQELTEPIRLVLDDVHVLVEPDTLHGLDTFIRNQPRTVRLVLCSRFDPPLSLHRLRLAGQLRELRADRLRLSEDETATVLAKDGVQLSEQQVHTLNQRTAGWAAGVRLAALALAAAADLDAALAEYSGNNRSVADYLIDEVLSAMSEDTLDFLRATSVVDPIPATLAAELSGRKDAGSVLDALEHETGLVQAVGRGRDSYRVQPLLRSYLIADLQRHAGRHRVAELHVTAARWWSAEGDPGTALRHAMECGDTAVVQELLHRVGVSLLLTGDHVPLRRGLRGIGPAVVSADPYLSLISALTSLAAGGRFEAQGFLRYAVRDWPTDPTDELTVLRAVAEQLGAIGSAADAADRDDPELALPAEPALEALARLGRGVAWMRADHDRIAARRELELALLLARRHDLDYLAMQCLELLGVLAGVDGDIRRMQTVSAEAFSAFGEHGWEESAWSVGAATMLAFVALVRAEPADAARRAAAAFAGDNGELDPMLRFALRVVHGAAVGDCGEPARGLAELQRARTEFGDGPVSGELLAAAALLEFGAGLELGHHAAARTVQGWLADRTAGRATGGTGETAELHLMRSWAHSAAGRNDHARGALRPVLAGSSPPLLGYSLVEAWLQETMLAALAGERPAARRALQTALEIAEPLDALRPFARIGTVVRELLASQFGGQLAGSVASSASDPADTFAARALAVERHGRSEFAAVLSERELTVLSMLPSLLSLEEIAGELTVSVNTVKSHVRSIYAKLGVSSRRTAVLTAYEHGLLSGDIRPA